MSAAESLRRAATFTTHHLHTLPIVVLMAHSRCNCRCAPATMSRIACVMRSKL